MSVRGQKTQISLGVRLSWSESMLYSQRVTLDPIILHVNIEDPDQIELFQG